MKKQVIMPYFVYWEELPPPFIRKIDSNVALLNFYHYNEEIPDTGLSKYTPKAEFTLIPVISLPIMPTYTPIIHTNTKPKRGQMCGQCPLNGAEAYGKI